ncbi:serine/threonine dehydratase [Gordonia sp. (in: high G+C Gram-positive bacteria)]|uniref:serine/threonine dehydratase n=3 Tax=Gordonia sp. (in: high G+C Gram-positive bacteria) TaxID=84139 RepID=UPI0026026B07|nr:serine/threonine dehydratase [Gordonia sp. (in: high G+C Gram-positive bacteria)]HMS74945.1 serine/threonine dehydratase [Gordonia sp. (in: high G+C Gram-positive bacteria)]
MRISRGDIQSARARIAGRLRRTPVLRTEIGTVNGAVEVALKLEFTQLGGSFKVRGSLNATLHAQEQGLLTEAGVLVASGGNAAIGAAHAARIVGVPCTVVVPEAAPRVKVAALRDLGAQVHLAGDRYQVAAEVATSMADESGALLLHAYDLPDIVAGAGTIAPELAADVEGPLTIVTCVGGGGLIAGLTTGMRSGDRIVGAEPVGASCLHQALAADHRIPAELDSIAADSLGATEVGEICWNTVAGRDDVSSVVVTDDDIVAARAALWHDHRLLVEHGTAAALAAVTTGQVATQPDSTICVVLCGANTAVDL